MKDNAIKVHWCNIDNYGDAINPYLISKISGCAVKYRNFQNPDFKKEIKNLIKTTLKLKLYDINRIKKYNENETVILGIGSLLNRSRKNFKVWGTGYMNNFERAQGGTLFAVRGRFSAEKLQNEGFDYCAVWGDPALLMPVIYNPIKKKTFSLGIIPHLKDYIYFKELYKNDESIKVIDLKTTEIEKVTDQILECEKIVSTSLHGVIVAQAYQIPTLWIQKNHIDTDGIKFNDYFDSVGIDLYDGFTNYKDVIEECEKYFVNYEHLTLIRNDLRKIQLELLKVAPFKVKEEYFAILEGYNEK